MNAMPEPTTQQEREAFEVHIRKTWRVPADYLDWALKLHDGVYQDSRAQDQWSGWLARSLPPTDALRVREWMPIESAPRDGTTVLLWEKYSDAPVVGYYSARREKWFADQEHYDTDGNACVIDKLIQDMLTHWQPLPAPPAALARHEGESNG